MRLKEYQGKELLKRYGISVPKGKVICSIENVKGIAKAQVLSGKRGKRGLIRESNDKNQRELFRHCKEILVEERLEIEKEYYLALTIDRIEKEIVILFSEEGGIDIEEGKKVLRVPYGKMRAEFSHKEFFGIIDSMHRLMRENDAILVEINPLALVKGKLIAADAKIILDDNAAHGDEAEEQNEVAAKHGLSYVELEGDIAIIGNGAGLVMGTLDTVAYFGGRAANFLDLGGGADNERMAKALEIVVRKKPRVVFINIFGGITRCDDIARGLVEARKKIKTPLIVRMIGTNEEEAKRILSENGIKSYDSMEECARMAVRNVDSD
jgi:succinyl-CoA synthetase beta subunit